MNAEAVTVPEGFASIEAYREQQADIATEYGDYYDTPATERFLARLRLLATYVTDDSMPDGGLNAFRKRFASLEAEVTSERRDSWPSMHCGLNWLEGEIYVPIRLAAKEEFEALSNQHPELKGLQILSRLERREIDGFRERNPGISNGKIASCIARYSPRFDALIHLALDSPVFVYGWTPQRLPLFGY